MDNGHNPQLVFGSYSLPVGEDADWEKISKAIEDYFVELYMRHVCQNVIFRYVCDVCEVDSELGEVFFDSSEAKTRYYSSHELQSHFRSVEELIRVNAAHVALDLHIDLEHNRAIGMIMKAVQNMRARDRIVRMN